MDEGMTPEEASDLYDRRDLFLAIEFLDMPPTANQRLRRAGIECIGDLARKDLPMIRKIGDLADEDVQHLRHRLRLLGLNTPLHLSHWPWKEQPTEEQALNGYRDLGLFTEIETLDLSPRAYQILKHVRKLNYVGDLVTEKIEDLLKTKNFGKICLDEIKGKLRKRGLRLNMQLKYWPPEDVGDRADKYREETARKVKEPLRVCFARLTREKIHPHEQILETRFAAAQEKKQALQTIGDEMKLTHEGVRFIETQIIQAFRNAAFFGDVVPLRLEMLMRDHLVPLYLDQLAGEDPYFKGVEPELLRNIIRITTGIVPLPCGDRELLPTLREAAPDMYTIRPPFGDGAAQDRESETAQGHACLEALRQTVHDTRRTKIGLGRTPWEIRDNPTRMALKFNTEKDWNLLAMLMERTKRVASHTGTNVPEDAWPQIGYLLQKDVTTALDVLGPPEKPSDRNDYVAALWYHGSDWVKTVNRPENRWLLDHKRELLKKLARSSSGADKRICELTAKVSQLLNLPELDDLPSKNRLESCQRAVMSPGSAEDTLLREIDRPKPAQKKLTQKQKTGYNPKQKLRNTT